MQKKCKRANSCFD